jgi:hypothetical protein
MGKKRKKVDKSSGSQAKTKRKKALIAAVAENLNVPAPVGERLVGREVAPASTIDLWFDPSDPWTWIASRWLLDVETVRSVKTCLHVMNSSLLDGAKNSNDDAGENEGSGPARVALAVAQQYGQEQLAAFYTAIGTRIHDRRQGPGKQTIDHALADVGLPPELAELAETDDNDDDLLASHRAGIDPVGDHVVTPVMHVNGMAFVGPVLSARPRGEDAGRVFDAVLALACDAGFVELRRTRPTEPDFSRDAGQPGRSAIVH